MKRKKKLTAKTVNALKAEDRRYRVWDTDLPGFHVRVSPEGRIAYALSYRHNGSPKEYTIGRHGSVTADMARDIAKKRLGKVADGVDVQAEKKRDRVESKKKRYNTLKDFIDKKYEPWALVSLKTGKEAVRCLRVDFPSFQPKKLTDITPWLMEGWIREARAKNFTPSTINRRAAVLKSCLSKAVEWGVIGENPLSGTKLLKTDKIPTVTYLTAEQESALREALVARQGKHRRGRDSHNKWLRARGRPTRKALKGTYTDHLMPIVLLALNTGMRRGELFSLEWRHVDLKGRVITVAGSGAKSGHTRHIPMSDEAFAVLVAWRNQNEGDGLVFPSPDTGERMDNLKTAWGGLIREANLKGFRFHDLRHTFASKLVMAKVDLNTVRELLGHSSIDMTLRYAHLAPEHKAAAVAKLNK